MKPRLVNLSISFCIALIALLSCQLCGAQEPIEWLTGTSLAKARQKKIGISWNDAPLSDSLKGLAQRQRIAIVLDRRVDPDQLVSFSSRDQSFEETLLTLCDSLALGAVKVDNRFYFVGTRQAAAELSFRRKELTDQLRKLPKPQVDAWAKISEFDCPRLSEPAKLLAAVGSDAGLDIEIDTIPHDVWPEIDLPELRFVDQVILLVYGFDLWPSVAESGRVMFHELKEASAVEVKVTSSFSSNVKRQVQERFGEIKVAGAGRNTRVTATPLVHYEIKRLIAAANRPSSSGARDRESVTVSLQNTEAGIDKILEYVADRMELELEYDASLGSQLAGRVFVDVSGVTYDELIEEVLQSTGLNHRIESGKLIIFRPR